MNVIYIQTETIDGEKLEEKDYTWCVDKINESDITYIKINYVNQFMKALIDSPKGVIPDIVFDFYANL